MDDKDIINHDENWVASEKVIYDQPKSEINNFVKTSGRKSETSLAKVRAELGVEQNIPFSKGDIEKAQIGIHHTMGFHDYPTRVLFTLKGDKEVSVPWDEAIKYLPPDFKNIADTGIRTRLIDKHVAKLILAVQSGTDVTESSGRIKSGLLRLFGTDTKPSKWLNELTVLARKLNTHAEYTFAELQNMVDVDQLQELDAGKIVNGLKSLEDEFHSLRDEIISSSPEIANYYKQDSARLAPIGL